MGKLSRNDLHAAVLDDLKDRSQWDTRQGMFYKMRHNGLRRKTKPWPGASDAHFPLSDTVIQRLAPFYFQQIFATDLIAQFTPIRDKTQAFSNAAGQWFDYQLKQKSNLETEILACIDFMLMSGRGVMKTFWDEEKKQLQFQNVDPQHIIVPTWTRDIMDADRIVHVQHYSQDSYRRNPLFNQDEGMIKRITGAGTDIRGDNQKVQSQYQREGLTYNEENYIIVWEVWTRDADSNWNCETFSPLRPEEDVRATYKLGKEYYNRPPFCQFEYEVKDGRWYSPRGITEIVAVHEAELTKTLNEKNDYMTLVNRPLFRSAREIPNAANLKFSPGQILPYDIQPVTMPAPPVSFDQSMMFTRDIAEQRVATPDFGMSQSLQNTERRTATEINQISNLFSQSSDLRLRIFRIGLGRLYNMAWDLVRKHSKGSLNYWYEDTVKEIPGAALSEQYHVRPTGSADGVNRDFIYQRSVNRMQMFAGDPFINQGELRKSVLEADDVALVRRLYADPGLQMADQAEDQANELTFMRLGFPAVVKDLDDHATHIRTVLGYIQLSSQSGRQVEPMEMQRIQEHIKAHLELLHKKDKKAAKELEAEIAGLLAASQPADDPQQQVMPPGAGMPMEGPPMGSPPMNAAPMAPEPMPQEAQPVGASYAA